MCEVKEMEYREPAEIEIYMPKEGIVLRDISLIAIDQNGEGKILAIGNEAKYVQAAETKIYSPMKEGKIAEWEDSCKIIRWYMHSTWGKRHATKKAKVVVCTLPDLTGIEKKAFEEVLYRAGAKNVILSEMTREEFVIKAGSEKYDVIISIGQNFREL